MGYPDAAWERAITVREVMLKAVSGELHWFQAADILDWSPRTLRRWRTRYEAHGYAGRVDKRLLRPSKRRVPPGERARPDPSARSPRTGRRVPHVPPRRRLNNAPLDRGLDVTTGPGPGVRRRQPPVCVGNRLERRDEEGCGHVVPGDKKTKRSDHLSTTGTIRHVPGPAQRGGRIVGRARVSLETAPRRAVSLSSTMELAR